jgi:hypothetical protein
MGRKLSKDIPPLLKNVMRAYGEDTLLDLSARLGLPYSTVRNWYTRDVVPDAWVRKAALDTGWSEGDLRSRSGRSNADHSSSLVASHIEINRPANESREAPRLVKPAVEGRFDESPKLKRYSATFAKALTGVRSPDEQLGYGARDMNPDCWVMHQVNGRTVDLILIPAVTTDLDGITIDPVAGEMAVSRRWMQFNLGEVAGTFATVRVTGDSMAPTFREGETVVVDTTRRDLDTGGVFALRRGRDVVIRRLILRMNGAYDVLADNPVYPGDEMSEEDLERMQCIGRVVWPKSR